MNGIELLTSPTFNCTAITLACIFKNFSPCDITNAAARWCRGFQLSVGDMFFSHGPKNKKKINIMTLTIFTPEYCLFCLSPSLPRYTSVVAQ